MKTDLNKNDIFPNKQIPSVCFIKNTIKNPNIIVGDYTYYDDKNHPEDFEKHVTHHYDFIGDKLIIGKFCQIASGVEFIMNGANHYMEGFSTYPFNIMGHGLEKFTPKNEKLPLKGDTIIGNDVWIGQNVTFLPGVHVGDGAIIGANSVVAKDIPAYHIAVGNPCKVVKARFNHNIIECLENLAWWNWDDEKIFSNIDLILSGNIEKLLLLQNGSRRK